jgi:hypothetical protein
MNQELVLELAKIVCFECSAINCSYKNDFDGGKHCFYRDDGADKIKTLIKSKGFQQVEPAFIPHFLVDNKSMESFRSANPLGLFTPVEVKE